MAKVVDKRSANQKSLSVEDKRTSTSSLKLLDKRSANEKLLSAKDKRASTLTLDILDRRIVSIKNYKVFASGIKKVLKHWSTDQSGGNFHWSFAKSGNSRHWSLK